MQRFRFRLQAVETVRRHEELMALRGLAVAQRALQRELSERDSWVSFLQRSTQQREDLSQRKASPADYQLCEAQILGTKKRILAAGYAIRRAQRAVDQALAVVLKKRRALRAIEVLREKAEAQYRKERKLWDAKQLDDLMVTGHGRDL